MALKPSLRYLTKELLRQIGPRLRVCLVCRYSTSPFWTETPFSPRRSWIPSPWSPGSSRMKDSRWWGSDPELEAQLFKLLVNNACSYFPSSCPAKHFCWKQLSCVSKGSSEIRDEKAERRRRSHNLINLFGCEAFHYIHVAIYKFLTTISMFLTQKIYNNWHESSKLDGPFWLVASLISKVSELTPSRMINVEILGLNFFIDLFQKGLIIKSIDSSSAIKKASDPVTSYLIKKLCMLSSLHGFNLTYFWDS